MTSTDWNPSSYGRFMDQRLRPALDLLARIGDLPPGDIVDLGCGAGAVAPALRTRFPERRIVGMDSSPSMLEKAKETGVYAQLHQDDASAWVPERPVALIYSNAVLHWVGEHGVLLPRLAASLVAGGTLAVQMPHQNRAPSHRLWHDIADQLFPDRIPSDAMPGIAEPGDYFDALSGLGEFALWETEYFQILPPVAEGHPVRHFTSATFARPILNRLSESEAEQLIARYDAAMERAYPRDARGAVLFPFRRMFFTLDKRS
jgi:trans-aconitate 2-methyltransferase